ncbi:MAG TPA: hypothetical protein VFB62_13985, partial [Polyangiaceae bacterium]|nr:hypothetical protein [Polyangiaceae bacterium]
MRALPILFLVACSSSNVATLEHTPKTFDTGAPLRIGPPRKGPHLNAEGDERGIDIRVRLDQLPEDIAGYVLRMRSWDDADNAGSLFPMACDDGHVLRFVGRDAFALREGDDDAWLAVHLAPPEIERGKAYAVVGCLKSKQNVLHPIGEGYGQVVAMTSTPTHLGMLSTPSGAIAWEAVEKGHQLVGYDATSDRQVVTEVIAMHERALPAVDIALDDGRILSAPGSQEYWQPEKKSYQAASQLAAGDELLSDEGRARVVSVQQTDMRTFGLLDVSSPDTYFRDGLLVRDAQKSTSSTPDAYRPPRSVALTPAPLSYDCYLTALLSIAKLPEQTQSIAIMAAPQPDHRGARRSQSCSAGTLVQEVRRRTIEAVLESGTSTIELWLRGDAIDCDGSYSLRACARTDHGVVSLGPAVYGKAGSSCFAAGTPI